jgi:conjugative relaxase-like TrwC/TraI family protein
MVAPTGRSGVAWMRMMGVDSVAYHRSTVMDRADDHPAVAQSYYSSRGETPLEWGGGGAARLGLEGFVSPEHYEDVFGPGGARDPVTGQRLAATKRPGLELVVSAHKSVAELGVIGRVEDMHAILDAETAGTLEYFEALTREQGGRRGRVATRTPTSGMTYAVTRHATSRAGDPNPHDHVLIANVVEMLDDRGGWKAADTALWREHLHAATALGRVRSAQVAVELGYGIEPDSGRSGRLGHWAIAGIPNEAMAIHSKRADQIDAVLGTGTETAYRERAIAARRTRTAKSAEPVDDLVERWRNELTARGLDIGAINAAVHVEQGRRIAGHLDATALDRLAGRLLEPDGRLAADKVFSRRDVVVVAAPHVFGLDRAVLEDLVDRVLGHSSAIELESNVSGRDAVSAPRCVIDTERAIAAKARHRHQLDTAPVIPTTIVDGALRHTESTKRVESTESPRRAVRGVCSSGRSMDVIIGVAGAGKTTALSAVREACELDGRRVLVAATSGQAARTVGQDSGIESYTVASLLSRLRFETVTLGPKDVVILDEAGMTDDMDLHLLIDHTGFAGARLILVATTASCPPSVPAAGSGPWPSATTAASGNSTTTSANPTSVNASLWTSCAPGPSRQRSSGCTATSASSPHQTAPNCTEQSSTDGSPTSTRAPTRSCWPGNATPSPLSTSWPAPPMATGAGSPSRRPHPARRRRYHLPDRHRSRHRPDRRLRAHRLRQRRQLRRPTKSHGRRRDGAWLRHHRPPRSRRHRRHHPHGRRWWRPRTRLRRHQPRPQAQHRLRRSRRPRTGHRRPHPELNRRAPPTMGHRQPQPASPSTARPRGPRRSRPRDRALNRPGWGNHRTGGWRCHSPVV